MRRVPSTSMWRAISTLHFMAYTTSPSKRRLDSRLLLCISMAAANGTVDGAGHERPHRQIPWHTIWMVSFHGMRYRARTTGPTI